MHPALSCIGAHALQVGHILVKELLQYKMMGSGDVPVSMIKMRSLPR